jgi:hypothetical protein
MAYKTFGKLLVQEQEVMNNITDIIMELYIAESLALRVEKLERMKGKESISLYTDMLDVFMQDAGAKIRKWGFDAVYSTLTGDQADKMTEKIESLTCAAGVNVKDARRRIADKLIEDNSYKF